MASDGSRTDLQLLHSTQEYLRSVLKQSRPDALVTSAWDRFYRVYDALMRRFIHSQGLDGADVDDCLQAVWMDVAFRLVKFEHPVEHSGLRSWLYTVVRGKSNDLLRRKLRNRTKSLDTLREAGSEPAASEADALDTLEEQWKRALLETVLDDLRVEISETNWRLLRMRCLEGRDVLEVAEELGLTSQQVWYRQRRLMKKMRSRVAVFTGNRFGGSRR